MTTTPTKGWNTLQDFSPDFCPNLQSGRVKAGHVFVEFLQFLQCHVNGQICICSIFKSIRGEKSLVYTVVSQLLLNMVVNPKNCLR